MSQPDLPLLRLRGAVSVCVGLLTLGLSYLNQSYGTLYYSYFGRRGGGDFFWAWRAARDLLAGKDIYAYPFHGNAIPYPLTAALLSIPFAPLPEHWAGPVFFGLSCGLLAWGLSRQGQWYRLLVFGSGPFCFALFSLQWSPLLMAAALLPVLLVTILAKPHLGLAIMLNRWSWLQALICGAVVLLSLLIYPRWPLTWVAQIGDYRGFVPVLTLPLGPLLLLALLTRHSARARLLLSLAVVPQHFFFYDQLLLFLLPETPREFRWATLVSWVPVVGMLLVGGLREQWIVLALYLPLLALVLCSERAQLLKQLRLLFFFFPRRGER